MVSGRWKLKERIRGDVREENKRMKKNKSVKGKKKTREEGSRRKR